MKLFSMLKSIYTVIASYSKHLRKLMLQIYVYVKSNKINHNLWYEKEQAFFYYRETRIINIGLCKKQQNELQFMILIK